MQIKILKVQLIKWGSGHENIHEGVMYTKALKQNRFVILAISLDKALV